MAGSNGMVVLKTTFSTAGGAAQLRVSLWGRRCVEEPVACSSHITPYVKTSQGENWGLRGPPQAHLSPLRQGNGEGGGTYKSLNA